MQAGYFLHLGSLEQDRRTGAPSEVPSHFLANEQAMFLRLAHEVSKACSNSVQHTQVD